LVSAFTFVVAILMGANGFVAAFIAGSAFGAFAGRGEEREVGTWSRPVVWHR
jgi:hypothetical protein